MDQAQINKERLKLFYTISICKGMIEAAKSIIDEIAQCNQYNLDTLEVPQANMLLENPLQDMSTLQKCMWYKSIIDDFDKKIATAGSVYKTSRMRKQATTGEFTEVQMTADDIVDYTLELERFTKLQVQQLLIIIGKNICPDRGVGRCVLY